MELIERYLFAVLQEVPKVQRAATEQQLRAEIDQRLAALAHEPEAQETKISFVLEQLGDPKLVAQRFGAPSRSLIGPNYFPTYIKVLKIVAIAIFVAVNALSILRGLTAEVSVWETLTFLFNALFQLLLQAAAIVTIIFAVFEYRQVDLAKMELFEAKDLPKLPKNQLTIPKLDSIVAIILTLIFFSFIIINPSITFMNETDVVESVIQFFDPNIFAQTRWLIVGAVGIGVIQEVLKLVWGRWNWQRATMNAILTVISAGLGIAFFANSAIWSPALLELVATVNGWTLVPLVNTIIIIVIIVSTFECFGPLRKVYRYEKTQTDSKA